MPMLQLSETEGSQQGLFTPVIPPTNWRYDEYIIDFCEKTVFLLLKVQHRRPESPTGAMASSRG